MSAEETTMSDDRNRRRYERHETSISVDYASGDTFLFSYITNISEMGIFIRTEDPLPVGTEIRVRIGTAGESRLELNGTVVWVNPMNPLGDNINPGMGVRFDDLSLEDRERVVALVRTIAYLDEGDDSN